MKQTEILDRSQVSKLQIQEAHRYQRSLQSKWQQSGIKNKQTNKQTKTIQKSVAMPSIQKPDRNLRVKAAPGKEQTDSKEQIDRSLITDYCRNKGKYSWLLAPVSEIKVTTTITTIRGTDCGGIRAWQ